MSNAKCPECGGDSLVMSENNLLCSGCYWTPGVESFPETMLGEVHLCTNTEGWRWLESGTGHDFLASIELPSIVLIVSDLIIDRDYVVYAINNRDELGVIISKDSNVFELAQHFKNVQKLQKIIGLGLPEEQNDFQAIANRCGVPFEFSKQLNEIFMSIMNEDGPTESEMLLVAV